MKHSLKLLLSLCSVFKARQYSWFKLLSFAVKIDCIHISVSVRKTDIASNPYVRSWMWLIDAPYLGTYQYSYELLICCFIYLPLSVGVLCWSLFWYALLYALSSFAIILTRKRELVALLFCLSDVLLLLKFCDSSSRCCGLVCSVWSWYFLFILTYFFISIF